MNLFVNEKLVHLHMQFVMNGHWEKAVVVDSLRPIFAEREFTQWVSEGSDFALEVFFRDADRRLIFVGVRFSSTNPESLYRTVCAVVSLIKNCHDSGLAVLPQEFLRKALGLSLYTDEPNFLQVGVNNQWKSTGSCTIWRKGDMPAKVGHAIAIISSEAPQLLLPQTSNVMLEVAYDHLRLTGLGWKYPSLSPEIFPWMESC